MSPTKLQAHSLALQKRNAILGAIGAQEDLFSLSLDALIRLYFRMQHGYVLHADEYKRFKGAAC